MTLKNLLPRGTFGAQMVDLGMPQIVQNLKAHAWGDEVRIVPCFTYQLHIVMSRDEQQKVENFPS